MGATVHIFRVAKLPEGEGELRVLIQQWDKPAWEDVLSQEVGPDASHTLVHGECSGLRFVKVSDEKNVLCCHQCLLRISLPAHVKTIRGLRDLFVEKP